ncbi:alkaline phosphatase D family protein [Planobispora takensis]|uniref:Alkaline phosphatase n=1 Tax=Planobispora takensis TaxID=1367882 RepID=A0A8J3WW22_9ACTN|nr:alkaline phosphatase D family protein [Planobispora takensis]GII04554.1 hypothetical protein Pta02_65620 [Planobispora takensis]
MSQLSRRSFLVTGIAAGAAAGVPAAHAASGPAGGSRPSRELTSDPFTLGVASGDPDADGFVIWTRLAPQPLAEDGMGGVPARPFRVHWQVYADEAGRKVLRHGVATAAPEWGHSVHVEVDGLFSDRDYWYRFRVGPHVSPMGRARTAPHPLAYGSGLTMAFASCAQYEHGHFTAYRRLAEEHPDLVIHLGDYQYEYQRDTYTIPGGNVRHHEGPETETLANYRHRHALYKTDPDLQAAHAAAPWLVVWDDHELDNNWADEVPEKPEIPQPNFPARREAAFRAYYENMPLRRASVPRGIDMQLYRRIRWGRLAAFHMLDTRQYRSDQGCGDGYVASRQRITQGWVEAGVRNPVVLTGDVHAHWASDLKLDYDDPTTRTVGSELVTSSISTGGDGRDSDPATHPFLTVNPHLKFYNNQRGYVITKVERELLTADFKVLPQVTRAGAAAHTRATFVIEDRVPGVQQTYLRPLDPQARMLPPEDQIQETVDLETGRP